MQGYSLKLLQLKFLYNPSKIKQIYFEDIIQENLLQYLSQLCWNQLQSMHKYEENWKQYICKRRKNKIRDCLGMKIYV